MCGIMGYYSFGNALPDKTKIANMFTLLETRGRDASGYAFIENNRLIVNKAPVKSSELINSTEWKELTLPKSMILHTRLKTQGTEKNNGNNHPLYNKQGLCIVHNGIIHNDKQIFGRNHRDAEVDSEAIIHLLSSKKQGDKIKTLFDKIEGSFSVAVINKSLPGKLVLIRKDNPLDLYYDQVNDILYFCSERLIMQETLELKKNYKRGFNLGEDGFHFYEMENNYALIINEEGVESYKKYHSHRYRSYYDYDIDNVVPVECPFCFEPTTIDMDKCYNRCGYCNMEINLEDFRYV